ncbi:MAG: restriction endonuclease subunit S [Methylomonas sp.]|jgi:type I restriction enzyme S subunit|uniref:restriction endonuclease subunit S n=1 Tax=Methylomonas sp. TaxID=418 RepID=UPI0025EB592A|nr:restriction endonuclease subunit S [Methylomonas sp.]MCK9609284.1 restriction endonuclease subunit S [Methylomonas sp.]
MNLPKASLAEFAMILQGGRHGLTGNDFVDNGYPAYGAGGLNGKLETYEFDQQAIILSSIGARCGKCFLVKGKWTSLANTQVIIPDPTNSDIRYIWYQLNNESSWKRSGTAQPFIKPSDVKSRKVFFPKLSEQNRIANILEKGDSIRHNRQEAIRLADEFLRSSFFEIFGDPNVNSKQLSEKPIRDIAKVTTGSTPSREVPNYYGNFIEWIKSDNINTPSHYLTKATEGLSEDGLRIGRSAPAGSTLITCIAGSPSCIGNAAFADRTVSFNQQINALTPKPGIEPEFLYAVTLYSKRRIQNASTNSMKGMVSKGALEDVLFILPAEDQREKFVKIFNKVMSLQNKLQASAKEAEMNFASLTQRAFNGEL